MRYSIVVAIYNDAYLAPAFCKEVREVMSSHVGAASLRSELELIFVNDGSKDESIKTLLNLRRGFDFVRVIDLSRNFGQHQAIACGLREARGDIVLRMNVDMQDPPSEIPKLLDIMNAKECDLVVGKYRIRKSSLADRVTARSYVFLFRLLTGFDAPQNTSPLRAMSRRFVDAYNTLTEKSRFPQGLDQWMGFRHEYIEMEHRERADGRSSYTFGSRLRLAMNGILYFSDRPLQLVASTGFVAAALGVLLACYIAAEKILGIDYLPGYASLASIALIAFGLQLGSIGLLGMYVGKIFNEVQNRPLYIVADRFDRLDEQNIDGAGK